MSLEGTTKGDDLPVAFSSAVLLSLGRILVSMAGLGEVAREMLVGVGGAVSQGGMVTVSVLVGASHCREMN
jgi:hypothetical protein